MRQLKPLIAIGLASALGSANLSAAELTLIVGPIESTSGELRLALYDREEQFRKESLQTRRLAARLGELTITIKDLAPGQYALLVYHDVNDNGKLDRNLIGVPNEPWGGSLRRRWFLGPPSWSDTVFELKPSGQQLQIALK